MDYLNFSDMCVKYSTFLDDVAARVVHLLKHDANDPEFISQNKAFEMFGRGNVERWRKQGKVTALQASGQGRIPNSRPAALAADTARLSWQVASTAADSVLIG
jgi:hypothetical protein